MSVKGGAQSRQGCWRMTPACTCIIYRASLALSDEAYIFISESQSVVLYGDGDGCQADGVPHGLSIVIQMQRVSCCS